MFAASFSGAIEAEWLRLDPVRIGRVPASLSTPDAYVTVTDDGRPTLRVDVYAFGPDVFAFQDAIVWRENLVVGFGSHVHAISLADHSATTIDLGSYYEHLYPTTDYLLIASGERLFRLEPDRSVLWTSAVLAIDGVVVHESGPPIIRGEAQLDPPGGWKSFSVHASNGRPAQ